MIQNITKTAQDKIARLSYQVKVLAGFGVIILSMAAYAYVMHVTIQSVRETEARVIHSHKVIGHAQYVIKQLIDMETGKRGFQITGNEHFLEPYNSGREGFLLETAILENLVSGEPSQVATLQAIKRYAEEWQDTIAVPAIKLRRSVNRGEESEEDVIDSFKQEAGKQLMDTIRSIVEDFISVEQALIEKRQAESLRVSEWSFVVSIAGMSIAVIFGFVVVVAVVRGIASSFNDELAKAIRSREMVLNAAGEGIFGVDLDGLCTFINPKAERLLGLKEGELIGQSHHVLCHHTRPDGSHYPRTESPIFAAFMEGKIKTVDDEIFWRKDGSGLPVEYTSTPVFEDGETAGAVVVFRDIAERKATELALRKSDERFTKSQDFANIGTWDWNIQTGDLYWSDQIAPLFGHETGALEMTYDNFVAAIHPDDRERVTNAVTACVEKGIEYNIEHRAVWPDGTTRYLLEKGDVVRDDDGKPLNMLGVVQDITPAKEAEWAVQKSEEQYREIVEGTDDLVTVVDSTGHFLFVNHKANDIYGVPPEECVGRLAFDFIHPDDRESTAIAFNRWVTNKETCQTYENRQQNANGQVFYMLWTVNIYYDETGEIATVRSIARDITERHEMQAQLIQSSKMATLGEMATGVAHELNQPLNIMRMVLNNVLRKMKKNDANPEYLRNKLGKIDAQIERSTQIIDHMRIFGRKPGMTPELLDPRHMVDSTLGLIGEQLRLAGIEVTVESPGTCPPVLGHQVQVEQVLLNLFGNARDVLKERPDDDKRIAVTIGETSDNVVIAVEDTGGGISEDDIKHVFEPFFTTKDVGQGTGLGLSISYGIINDMGGNIAAANTDDGARFVISLPASNEDTAVA
ncbi:MAG: PAS domain S-box protein [Rhodospirillaceae bacterium]|jgi:PAS domain S-box-containing protein|nr:PAS domain S-box protein [Rhodospirillaceae bacterium]MBT4218865.1 PAS domain S-box protein [Rhodospirillaceae bacterium]MBT4463730.1 PAS domain S-box protein [Rhodospirillaceae bacterium]MBT5013539.1 PAS domain S-box protein [Rhodospirillaceae bacterium]MBT5309861.1 PAS domain S-box protein [Rhodospirillaceae bacterium]